MMSFLNAFFAVLRRDFLVLTSYRFAIWGRLIGVASGLCTAWFMARTFSGFEPDSISKNGGYFGFLLFGSLVAVVGHALIMGTSERIRSAQLEGTAEASCAADLSLYRWLWAELFASTIFSLLESVILIALALLFGWRSSQFSILNSTVAVLASFLALSPFGLLGASVTLLCKRIDPIGRVVFSASMLLSGIFYPVEVLPQPLKIIANFLPPTHVLELLRAVFLRGESFVEVRGILFACAVSAVAMWGFALLALKLCRKWACRLGSLGHY